MSAADRELVSEPELIELFRRRRPVPESFRAGVERRIAEKEREAERRAEEERRRPLRAAFLRRVAALFPGDALGGAAVGSAAGKLAGAKLLPTVLALPALMLGAALGTFAAGLRSLMRTSRRAPSASSPPRTTSEYFLMIPHAANADLKLSGRLLGWLRYSGLGLFLLAFLFGGRGSTDWLIAILLVSSAALVLTVRGSAKEGWLSRELMARFCLGLFMTVFLTGFFFAYSLHYLGAESDLGLGWTVAVLLGGSTICTILAPESPRRRFVLFLIFALFANLGGCTRSSPGDLRARLAAFPGDSSEPREWECALANYEALREADVDMPDLGPLRRSIESRIDQGAYFADFVLTAASRMGLIDSKLWRRLQSNDGYHLLEHDVLESLSTAPSIHPMMGDGEYLLHMLLATRELDPAELEHLTVLVERAWGDPNPYAVLKDKASCVRLFDLLGRSDLADAHRTEVHELLGSYWVPDRWGWDIFAEPGGFAYDPGERDSSVSGTCAAVELMARFGVPDGIDLRLLRGYLRGKSRARTLLYDGATQGRLLARPALLRLEREIGLPQRTWLEQLLGERLLIAALLMVGLCGLAIRMVPAEASEPRGAQP